MSQIPTTQDYLAFLRDLAAQVDDPSRGFFGPGSMAWRVNREFVLGLGGLRALLMQIAHPAVAQGVADHSDFRRKPFARAYSTLKAQQVIIFGTCDEAIQALTRIHSRHVSVQGALPADSTNGVSRYRANNPHLLFWVHATLIDTLYHMHNLLLLPLSEEESAQLYRETCFFARLMGIPPEQIPPSLQDFNAWMNSMLASDEIHVTPPAREIAASLLRLPLPIFRPLNILLAAGTLPPKLREGYQLDWTPRRETQYNFGIRLVRAVARLMPPWMRATPPHKRAMRRISVPDNKS